MDDSQLTADFSDDEDSEDLDEDEDSDEEAEEEEDSDAEDESLEEEEEDSEEDEEMEGISSIYNIYIFFFVHTTVQKFRSTVFFFYKLMSVLENIYVESTWN